jgi:mono/diheme cytochrome c family protein
VIGASLLLLCTAGGIPAADEGQQAADRGRFFYEVYCLSCHGESGKGDGPTAEVLKIRPTDLTRLRLENEGEFPREKVRSAIDGRKEVHAHGTRRMPIWGLTFQELDKDTNQEAEVRAKIDQLMSYLEQIQVSPKQKK